MGVLARAVIPALIGRTQVVLRMYASGCVISAGEPNLDIAPHNLEPLIEAQIAVIGVGEVERGQPASNAFSACPQRNLPFLEGEVVARSADGRADEQGRSHCHAVHISIAVSTLESLPDHIDLRPGIPAEIFITTDARTVIGYLLSPFLSPSIGPSERADVVALCRRKAEAS